MEVKITDNSAIFKKAKDEAVARALEAMGQRAEGYAKQKCPVETGRLHNSITHATQQYNGQGTYADNDGNSFSDASAKGKPEKDAVYIGTNVEYAQGIETGTHRRKGAAHFLRDAAANHADVYRQIAETQLRKG